MRSRTLAVSPLVALSLVLLATVHCGATVGTDLFPDGGPSANDGGLGSPGDEAGFPGADSGAPNPDAVGLTTAGKVDVLLMVDNSSSMADKAGLLAGSIGTLVHAVASTNDVHLGVITSSLGTMGGNACSDTGAQNTLAHLMTTGPGGAPVPNAAMGFLTYGAAGTTDVDAFIADAASLVQGVGEGGCGLEAQLESTYRFLVQPDPWQSVAVDPSNLARYVGTDGVVLAQRKAFLRPDSLVVIVLLTDEDDSSADPRSVSGQGWAFGNLQFPGSPVFRPDGKSTTAPRSTSACATDPASADCTSCAFAATCNTADAACQKIKSDPECQKNGGFYGPTEDSLNTRFQHMKQRYGIDPQFPLSRYVDGLTKQRVPDRNGEHAIVKSEDNGTLGDYVGTPTCTNPLFAASLPSGAGDELCNLAQGPRGKELVVFTVIGGVPEGLTGNAPAWTKILGANPAAYDLSGIDPHMIQSVTPRAGLPPPSSTPGDNGTDPVNGREWDTQGDDLQYACTFALPTPRTCTAADTSCDCTPGKNPPLCGASAGEQTRGKGYPTTRELRVAMALGDRGVAGSICPGDPTQGYTGVMNVLAGRVATRIRELP